MILKMIIYAPHFVRVFAKARQMGLEAGLRATTNKLVINNLTPK